VEGPLVSHGFPIALVCSLPEICNEGPVLTVLSG